MGKNQMTTKQNAINLATTARSEAAAIANGTKRTITQIITNWNECVKQAGFMCIYDFPTTGYSRKSQIADDLIRCAGQLDDYCEPNPHAPQTVEQQTREINAALTRVLDIDEAHTEALELNEEMNYHDAIADFSWELQIVGFKETRAAFFATMDEALAMNQVKDTWAQVSDLMVKHCTPYAMDAVHAEALKMDAERAHEIALRMNNAHDSSWRELAAPGAFEELPTPSMKLKAVNAAHAEALEMNIKKITPALTSQQNAAYIRQLDFFYQYNAEGRAAEIERAHVEAIKLDAQMMQDAWDNSDEVGRAIAVEDAHTEALELNSSYGECA